MVKAAERWAKKQIERARVAGPEYEEGVKAPERDPIKAAIAANEKRVANLQRSITDRTWEKTMGKLTMADWQEPTLAKGVARFPAGVEAAEKKITNFVTKFRPLLDGIQSRVRAMPQATDAQREARVLENLRSLKKAKGAWR
uniref:Uncharacterized protein n=1 Tax=viral metagenome TaxID=1070528 RepID=A0A6H1ZX97_9ZZZZ